MKFTYIFSLLLTFLLSAHIGFATPSEAEYGKYQETWTLLPEGSQEYRCYQELTLFTHTAMNSTYGETFITYNPQYQELKIHDSYTRQKDGTLVKTPANAFVEVLPQNADGMPAYNHLKEMVIVHTGLELGATIVLDYSIISRPGYLPEIDVCQPLLKSSPIKEYRLTFNLPDEKHPHYTTLASRSLPTKTATPNGQQFKWIFRNLPALSHAPEISLQNEDIPGILFTTYPSVHQALQTVYKQFDQPSNLKALAGQLTQNKKNPTEKLQAIHDYVITHISACSLPLSETGNRIRPADAVIRSAYATEVEKVNLLNSLLNAADIPASPAVAYYLNVDPEYCGLAGIGKWTVLTDIDGKSYQLDVNSKIPAATTCNFMLKLNDTSQIQSTPLTKHLQYMADIQWKNEKPQASVKATFTNNYLSYSPKFSKELLALENTVKIDQNAEHTMLEGESPVSLTQKHNYLLLNLPETHKGIAQQKYARYNSERHHNLLLPTLIEEEYTYSITLPDNVVLCTLPMEKHIDNKVGSLSITVQQKDRQVSVHRSLNLRKKQITPAEYPAFRQLMTEWDDPNPKQLLLKSNR